MMTTSARIHVLGLPLPGMHAHAALCVTPQDLDGDGAQVAGIERLAQGAQLVEDAAQRPHISLGAVGLPLHVQPLFPCAVHSCAPKALPFGSILQGMPK